MKQMRKKVSVSDCIDKRTLEQISEIMHYKDYRNFICHCKEFMTPKEVYIFDYQDFHSYVLDWFNLFFICKVTCSYTITKTKIEFVIEPMDLTARLVLFRIEQGAKDLLDQFRVPPFLINYNQMLHEWFPSYKFNEYAQSVILDGSSGMVDEIWDLIQPKGAKGPQGRIQIFLKKQRWKRIINSKNVNYKPPNVPSVIEFEKMSKVDLGRIRLPINDKTGLPYSKSELLMIFFNQVCVFKNVLEIHCKIPNFYKLVTSVKCPTSYPKLKRKDSIDSRYSNGFYKDVYSDSNSDYSESSFLEYYFERDSKIFTF